MTIEMRCFSWYYLCEYESIPIKFNMYPSLCMKIFLSGNSTRENITPKCSQLENHVIYSFHIEACILVVTYLLLKLMLLHGNEIELVLKRKVKMLKLLSFPASPSVLEPHSHLARLQSQLPSQLDLPIRIQLHLLLKPALQILQLLTRHPLLLLMTSPMLLHPVHILHHISHSPVRPCLCFCLCTLFFTRKIKKLKLKKK